KARAETRRPRPTHAREARSPCRQSGASRRERLRARRCRTGWSCADGFSQRRTQDGGYVTCQLALSGWHLRDIPQRGKPATTRKISRGGQRLLRREPCPKVRL